jgi:RNA polymerase sigma factor (sigma-70 family)
VTDDDRPVPELVREALAGRADAWDRLVERYSPLVVHLVRRFGLQGADAQDVVQTVWLRLVEHLGDIREPDALPGWISTTVRNECLRHVRAGRRVQPLDTAPVDGLGRPGAEPVDGSVPVDERVVDAMADAGRHEALLRALAELPDTQRRLLLLLLTDPPLTYAEISGRLGISMGSIGPLRARAVERMRRHPAVAAWAATGTAGRRPELRS